MHLSIYIYIYRLEKLHDFIYIYTQHRSKYKYILTESIKHPISQILRIHLSLRLQHSTAAAPWRPVRGERQQHSVAAQHGDLELGQEGLEGKRKLGQLVLYGFLMGII